jgi:hypothetical protein
VNFTSRIMEYIHSSWGNHIHEWCWMMLFFILQIFGKLVKNLKECKTNYTSLSKFLSSKSTTNDFNHRNFDRVSKTFKVQKISLFSAKCPFVKLSVRQNVHLAKCPSAKWTQSIEHLENNQKFNQITKLTIMKWGRQINNFLSKLIIDLHDWLAWWLI